VLWPLDCAVEVGLVLGVLGCLLGGRKAGKSLLLTFIASTSVLCGLTVVYITLELREPEVIIRLDSCLTGISIDDIQNGGLDVSIDVDKKLRSVLDNSGGRYIVKYFPPRAVSVKDIDSYLSDLRSMRDVISDVFIVDYAVYLISITKAGKDNTYIKGDHIYADLKALGSNSDHSYGSLCGHNCAVWTVSQVQRDAMSDEVIRMAKVDKSIAKVSKVDFLGSICKNDDEADSGMARLYIASCSYAPGNRGFVDE